MSPIVPDLFTVAKLMIPRATSLSEHDVVINWPAVFFNI